MSRRPTPAPLAAALLAAIAAAGATLALGGGAAGAALAYTAAGVAVLGLAGRDAPRSALVAPAPAAHRGRCHV